MLRHAGRDVRLAGNIGTPLVSEVARATRETIFVLEVSSFQLETVVSFRPRVAVLLDVSPDHLDWHPSFEAYVSAKERIFLNQRDDDWAVVYGGNRLTVDMARRTRSQKWFFDPECLSDLKPHLHLEGPWIVIHENGAKTPLVSLEEFQLPGAHNRSNAMAASAAAFLLGASGEELEDAILEFQGLPHALEQVAVVDGVKFYNDSKATNVQAVKAALESFDGGILLILGGRFKGGDFSTLREHVARRVKGIFAIGESREMVKEALEDAAPVEICADLESAVERAHRQAVAGDVVLLSPAGSSFDMFRDYRERGERFRAIVARLKGEGVS
jgi:UDP-N-acetylmuramoylalanine--D-glutamate ligase